MKKKALFLAIVLGITVTVVFSRERVMSPLGIPYYVYYDWDDFYKYWDQAAESYNYISIMVIPNFSDVPAGRLQSSTFGNMLTFSYCTTAKQLGATFQNSYPSGSGFMTFRLPEQLNQAIDYWNELLDSL